MRSKASLTMLILGLAMAGVVGFATGAAAHPGGGPREQGGMCGEGHGMGPGGGRGMGPGAGHRADMMEIHSLFASRDQIQRTVTQIPGGVRATTESDDPAVAAELRRHVQAMYDRLKDKQPINARDPLFAAIFQNADKIHVQMENTPKGITVTETSDDPAVVSLVRRHADVVSLFIKNGMPEMMRSH